MTKYLLQFSYSSDAWAKMIRNPTDRTAAVRAALEPAGGTLESLYFMFGAADGIVIYDVPDAEAAAAVSIAVGSTGAFRSLETHELIEPERLVPVLGKAGEAAGVYRTPGT